MGSTGGLDRRQLLALVAAGGGGLLLGGLGAGPAGAATAAPAAALDVRILQTASSLERLLVDTYGWTLAQAQSLPALAAFLTTTQAQHARHLAAFQDRTSALGAPVQDRPNPKFQRLVDGALPGVTGVRPLVDLATTLESVATDTYLVALTMLADPASKALVAGVMAVDAQHVATLRVVGALLDTPDLVAFPLPEDDVSRLPGLVGKVATPDALHLLPGPDGLAEPASGAVG